ncbi:hypothetical protein E5K00_12045 [Hymenobacter aquaticus]|uniref:Bulb-type lectin domain-containing protein n=1 Tax=Hymenobacter aquaticus TaxID=1867101 RepID=A0A4Z0QB13_9BACT|nr:hypothetical protein [Hymenobacter aquaticus]TGE25882.1 hypothetical protein E5K00_12045 [Hymenobacter aquaticus]
MNSVFMQRYIVALILLLTVACTKESEQVNPTAPITFDPVSPRGDHNSSASDVTELTDGSLFVLGSETTGTSDQVLGVKLTAKGDTIWTKRYTLGSSASPLFALGKSAVATTDGNVVITGISYQDKQPFVVQKLNTSNGAVVWQFRLPINNSLIFPSQNPLAATKDGSVLILTPGPQLHTFSITKLTADGQLISSTTQAGDTPQDIRPTTDGNFIIAGVTNVSPSPKNLFLTKVTPAGTVLWSQIYTDTNFGAENSVVQTTDGGYLVASGSELWQDARGLQVMKMDANGQKVFTNPFTSTIKGYANHLELASNGDVLLVGAEIEVVYTTAIHHPLYMRLDGNGNIEGTSGYDSTGEFAAVHSTQNGSLVFAYTQKNKLWVKRRALDGVY